MASLNGRRAIPRSRGLIIYRRDGEIDAIDAYSRRLTADLRAMGADVEYCSTGVDDAIAQAVSKPDWILLQYNPFAFGRGGVSPKLLAQTRRLRRLDAPLAVMVHEAWIDFGNPRSTAISLWQRAQLTDILSRARLIMTSTTALAESIGRGAIAVPVGTNIPPVPATPFEARERLGLRRPLVITLFGRRNPGRALDHAEAAISALAEACGPDQITVANLGADALPVKVPAGVEVRAPGPLAPDELSLWMRAGDLVLLPFTDGLSTRRSTLMAALAHERPVLGLVGANTEPLLTQTLELTPVGDLDLYARRAVELVTDHERLRRLGAAGGDLYRKHFDWPVVTATVSGLLADLTSPSRGRVTFVANDVGGSGGMERHTEQLLTRLLDSGHELTVVARTCQLDARPGLRVRRVPTPSRPFVVAYPAFFAVASLLIGRRRGRVLHTTGAIVARRADVITVHYCHHAPGARAAGSRASRSGLLYRLNQTAASVLSRIGESWCYRSGRAGVVCAVSAGVADELREAFPDLRGAVRSIPNGVDIERFAPQPGAPEQLRQRLSLPAAANVALFAGGDWERKGLRWVVAALEQAPGWHLVVAGPGDPEPLQALARRDGTLARVHFLGRVDDMPGLYAGVDAFVFPTAYEAFPLVALEAAASALPILITRVNGATELIRDGENGWFVERNAGSVAQRLNELAANPGRGRAVGAGARETAASYSWDAMADAYAQLYAQIIGTRPTGVAGPALVASGTPGPGPRQADAG